MKTILDSSMALAWLIARPDRTEAATAEQLFGKVAAYGAEVPALWFPELANTLLVLERANRITQQDASSYLADIALLGIKQDEELCATRQVAVLDLARTRRLSVYQATYLEFALRRAAVLATFDPPLAEAARAAGVRVFGDKL
jgi:predicted nucleic acid-binding protein